MKRILINATEQEEIRVAMVDGQYLYDLDIEHTNQVQKKSNIYKGTITRVEPSLNAAFVNYGAERHGFLPFKEVSKEYWSSTKEIKGRPSIKDVLKEGQEVLIQVEKEERGNKGASLTTFISLAGRFLVLMPNNPRAGGVSRRIEGEDRHRIKQILKELDIENGGAIVRTAGLGRELEELSWDLDYLKMLWKAIQFAHKSHPAPTLLYQESNLIIRTLRDYFRPDIGEIIFDKEAIYNQACEFVKAVMPHNLSKLKHYSDRSVTLFSRYQVEHQIESAFQREVTLQSGGAIVIDHTEALISIDVNSARATKGGDIEETAYNTNLEAADEVARQLRLRDLGGLVVIDFIDMMPNKNQRAVEKRLRDNLKIDRARVQIGRISRFGLLEMSRQRLRPSLGDASQIVCPRCSGHGSFRSIESLALSILRLIQDEAMKHMTHQVTAQVPIQVASFLLNEKRDAITKLQTRHKINIVILPNPHMDTPHYEIQRVRSQDGKLEALSSYEHIAQTDEDEATKSTEQTVVAKVEQPAVKQVMPDIPVPVPTHHEKPAKAATPRADTHTNTDTDTNEAPTKKGFMSRVFTSLFGAEDKPNDEAPAKDKPVKETATKKAKTTSQNNNRRKPQQRRKPANNQGNQNNRRQNNNRNNNNQSGNKQQNQKQGNARKQNQGNNRNQNTTQNTAQNTAKKATNPNQNRRKPATQNNNQNKQNNRPKKAQNRTTDSKPVVNKSVENKPDNNAGTDTTANNPQHTQDNTNSNQNRPVRNNRRNQYQNRNRRNTRNNKQQNGNTNSNQIDVMKNNLDEMDMTPIEIKIPRPGSPVKRKPVTKTDKPKTDSAKSSNDTEATKTTTSNNAKQTQDKKPKVVKQKSSKTVKTDTVKNSTKETSKSSSTDTTKQSRKTVTKPVNNKPDTSKAASKRKVQTTSKDTQVDKEAPTNTKVAKPATKKTSAKSATNKTASKEESTASAETKKVKKPTVKKPVERKENKNVGSKTKPATAKKVKTESAPSKVKPEAKKPSSSEKPSSTTAQKTDKVKSETKSKTVKVASGNTKKPTTKSTRTPLKKVVMDSDSPASNAD